MSAGIGRCADGRPEMHGMQLVSANAPLRHVRRAVRRQLQVQNDGGGAGETLVGFLDVCNQHGPVFRRTAVMK